VYDPIVSQSYYSLWLYVSGQQVPETLSRLGIFCADVIDAIQARVFGVQYVLEPPGISGPQGAVFDATVGDEALYRIPDSAPATISPVTRGTKSSPVQMVQPGPASWQLVTTSKRTSLLRLRLSAVPGWNASLDGHPLALGTWAGGALLEAQIPPGRHVVELHYWPRLFSLGILVAVLAALGLLSGALAGLLRARVVKARGARAP
jgi:hypothetical protein